MKAVTPFYMVPMPGEVKDPTQGNEKICRGLTEPMVSINKDCISCCNKTCYDSGISTTIALSRQTLALYDTTHYYYICYIYSRVMIILKEYGVYTTENWVSPRVDATVVCLQQDGHNIFSNLNASDYRQNLKCIRHCIIATDLVTFFPNMKKLSELIKTNTLDLNEELHQ